jgi:hypothetical protein
MRFSTCLRQPEKVTPKDRLVSRTRIMMETSFHLFSISVRERFTGAKGPSKRILINLVEIGLLSKWKIMLQLSQLRFQKLKRLFNANVSLQKGASRIISI